MSYFPQRLPFVVAGLLIATSLSAQQPVSRSASSLLRVRSLMHDVVLTPEYAVSVRGSVRKDGRSRWLRLSTEYETAEKWTDEVTFTYYVMLEGSEGDLPKDATSPFTMFSGSVTYVTLAEGKHQSTMFLDPQTFLRFGKPKAIAVEVSVNGQKVGEAGEPQNTVASKWWSSKTAHTVPLLNREESPWRFVEIETHETIRK